MPNKTQHNHTPSSFSRYGDMNLAILEGLLADRDLPLDRPDVVEQSLDDTFVKTNYDIQIEADEFLQSRLPLYSDRHPYEQ